MLWKKSSTALSSFIYLRRNPGVDRKNRVFFIVLIVGTTFQEYISNFQSNPRNITDLTVCLSRASNTASLRTLNVFLAKPLFQIGGKDILKTRL